MDRAKYYKPKRFNPFSESSLNRALIKILISDLEKARKQLRDAELVIEKYANIKNWLWEDETESNRSFSMSLDDLELIYSSDSDEKEKFAGKAAREYQRKYPNIRSMFEAMIKKQNDTRIKVLLDSIIKARKEEENIKQGMRND